LSTDFNFLEACEFADSVVNMRNKVARRQLTEQSGVQGLFSGKTLFYFILVISLEYLVICQDSDFEIIVNKALVYGRLYR
jgi:hypothetical protein